MKNYISSIRGGLGNRLFYCALKIAENKLKTNEPREVLLRLHGSKMMGIEDSLLKTAGIAAESVVQSIFAQHGNAPKIYRVVRKSVYVLQRRSFVQKNSYKVLMN